MAALIDISEAELLPLSEALRGRREVARVRLFDGGEPVPPRPMLWPCGLDEVSAPHLTQAETFDADLLIVRDAVVGGGGSQATRRDAHVYGWSAYSDYVTGYVEQDITPETWAFDPRGKISFWVQRAFSVLHFNLMWGHWLTEVFPKLFAIRELNRLGVDAPVLVPSNAPVYVSDLIRDVLPGQEIIVYNPQTHVVRVRRLLLPPMLQRHYVFHRHLGPAIDGYVRRSGGARSPGSRLFVSRSGMRTTYAYRELVNEAELEAAAVRQGFRVMRPETLPWREQLAAFAGAEVIAGEFGSGLHNTLFSPRGAKVVALNWIGEIQSRIAIFRGQDLGYLLPDDGRPRVFHHERELQRYRIDPAEFRERLRFAVDVAERDQSAEASFQAGRSTRS